ncbi:Resolvase-like protein [Vibrio aestuarianus]|uniref:recombinase family protein n=1 Tax=Vibrio aestuarianus TaxID=28171 RepID=UPI001455F654|nr:recombinase family protein [Vibrio aestuarianus]NLS63585.1 recombinase family protein [Vibrio aestuarianus subsp. francensis]CAH8188461.1 Resolvase-like protein [Vibrio aestuarianus]
MIGYIRVSDSRKADGESQREAIKTYAAKRGILISDWIEEHVSASKTELSDRKLSSLIASQQSIIVSDITRLGRSKVMELVGAIGQIVSYGELHLAYNNTTINAKNADNAEILFTVIGESFASAVEAQRRSDRAKAGHAKRKAKGLSSGRQKGQKVKSKLDDHTAYILNQLDNKTSKAEILRKLKERGISISRSRFYSWLEARGLHNKKAEFQADMFLN